MEVILMEVMQAMYIYIKSKDFILILEMYTIMFTDIMRKL